MGSGVSRAACWDTLFASTRLLEVGKDSGRLEAAVFSVCSYLATNQKGFPPCGIRKTDAFHKEPLICTEKTSNFSYSNLVDPM
jgi:hypothetical protein